MEYCGIKRVQCPFFMSNISLADRNVEAVKKILANYSATSLAAAHVDLPVGLCHINNDPDLLKTMTTGDST